MRRKGLTCLTNYNSNYVIEIHKLNRRNIYLFEYKDIMCLEVEALVKYNCNS